jgi:hypothetical protein
MSKESESDRGFKVEDRRRFDTEGRPRGCPSPSATAGQGRLRQEGAGEPAPSEAPCAEAAALPEIDFSTFILSLVTSAMVHLGEAPHPEGAQRKDLALAKQTIDIIGLLRDKTQGNLTPDESRLLDEVLFDLRLRFCGCRG